MNRVSPGRSQPRRAALSCSQHSLHAGKAWLCHRDLQLVQNCLFHLQISWVWLQTAQGQALRVHIKRNDLATSPSRLQQISGSFLLMERPRGCWRLGSCLGWHRNVTSCVTSCGGDSSRHIRDQQGSTEI